MGYKKRSLRVLGSKWKKTAVLMRSKELRPFIPDTRRWIFRTLRTMLKTYKMIYVKPVRGSFGQGVIRAKVKQQRRGTVYNYHLGKKKRHFQSYARFYKSINKERKNKAYLVQMGIKLLKFNKRPFDVRVMVQRTDSKPWKATGIIGRVAHPERIVTNYHNEGTPLPIETLMRPYLTKSQRIQYKRILKMLGVKIAEGLNKTYPGFREIGVDVGIDRTLHPWVLEVNTSPDPFIFQELKNKSTYRSVLKYAKLNGRFKSRKKRKKSSRY